MNKEPNFYQVTIYFTDVDGHHQTSRIVRAWSAEDADYQVKKSFVCIPNTSKVTDVQPFAPKTARERFMCPSQRELRE